MKQKNPIIEDLLWRHAVKKYDPTKKIPKEDLDVLYEGMRLSAYFNCAVGAQLCLTPGFSLGYGALPESVPRRGTTLLSFR